MIFSVDVPCEFPRLKFSIYDYSLFSSNESLGESILNLKKTLNKLKKEGRVEVPKTWINFSSPMKQEYAGKCLIQMNIIPKSEADGNPVGEA